MRIHPDQAAAVVIVAAAAVVFAQTLGFDAVPPALAQGMGAREFPQLLAALIAGFAVVMALQARGREAVTLDRIDGMVWLLLAAIPLYMGLLWLVGLPVSLAIALLALGLAWGERRMLALVVHAVALPTVIWLVFVKGLKVPLPTGVLGQMVGA